MGIYFDPFYILVFVLIKHQASCGWGLPLLSLVTNSMGQWPSQGLVGTDMLLPINSAWFPALWNLFLILSAFPLLFWRPSLWFAEVIVFLTWKALQWAKCVIILSGIIKKEAWASNGDEFSPCTATLGTKRKTASFFLLPFLLSQESAWVTGKWSWLPWGRCSELWPVARKRLPQSWSFLQKCVSTACVGAWSLRMK